MWSLLSRTAAVPCVAAAWIAAGAPGVPLVSAQPDRTTVAGVVRDPQRRPVSGAWVAAAPDGETRVVARVRTDAAGRYRVSLVAGSYTVTATPPRLTAARARVHSSTAGVRNADLVVGAEDGVEISGTLTVDGRPEATALAFTRSSGDADETFALASDRRGSFRAVLPRGGEVQVTLLDARLVAARRTFASDGARRLVIAATRLDAPPRAVVSWVRAAAIPLRTAAPDDSDDDLLALDELIGAARVVALGEATHGTHEFFTVKHRVIRHLVERRGFSVVAIEASYAESLALDAYVLTGVGDPRAALASLYSWNWTLREILALVQWMRAWNADPRNRTKVRIIGFDMQVALVALARVRQYLAAVDPALAARVEAIGELRASTYDARPPAERTMVTRTLDDVLSAFDASRVAWSAATSPGSWAEARQHAVVARQAEELMRADTGRWRDEAMALNVRWIFDQLPADGKMVVWAHNRHVSRYETTALASMGAHLRRALGDDYLAVGMLFGNGRSLASSALDPTSRSLAERTLPAPPRGDVTAVFAQAPCELCLLDLRDLPSGVVASWFAAPHILREVGAAFAPSGDGARGLAVLPERYDAVLYIHRTTAARQL